MNYSKQAQEYINSEHIRFLGKDNHVPTLEERVMAAFDAGRRSTERNFPNLDCYSNNKGSINFPKINE
jgi:hypothetical protein